MTQKIFLPTQSRLYVSEAQHCGLIIILLKFQQKQSESLALLLSARFQTDAGLE